ncbi:MAG: hypothetical protein K0Q66_1799, partial [Chitinophagaceae bacterium]|nr:hypothetical protein [Chitinophagaceae bacterium]
HFNLMIPDMAVFAKTMKEHDGIACALDTVRNVRTEILEIADHGNKFER